MADRDEAAEAIFDRIKTEAENATPEGLASLGLAYSHVVHGPQGGAMDYDYDNRTRYDYTSDVTHHEGENKRHRQAGFQADGPEGSGGE